jgi:plastocyanin
MQRFIKVAVAATVFAAAAAMAQNTGKNAGHDAGKTVQIKIGDLAFAPADITVHAGDTIEWVNEDFLDHTATATDAASGWDITIAAGRSAKFVPASDGVLGYFCRYHPNMTGQIRVIKD